MDSNTATSSASEMDSRAKAQAMRGRDKEFSKWSTEDVCEFFVDNGLEEVGQKCKEAQITGSVLHHVTDEQMKEMRIGVVGLRLRVRQLLNTLKAPEGKVFNDPIHGHIELHPLCVRIIDTPQFQRLRHIKQLGGCYLVFHGASHNRFEHSLGVAHLAGELVRQIRSKQPELKITDQDILCVEIAGLCHNLGHGPYSYVFEKLFMPMVQEIENKAEPKWRHEDASEKMFDYLVKANKLGPLFERYGLVEQDMNFIKEQINRPLENVPNRGRTGTKSFLYEVVANKRNLVDVDKWDYFARDCHHLGISNSFDHSRSIKFARVLEEGGQFQIAYRDKEMENVYDMFHTKRRLHRQAYQHKTNKLVEQMITDVLLAAEPFLKFTGEHGSAREGLQMSEAVKDMVAYSKLTDQVIERIFYSDQKDLEKAQKIAKRVYDRDLYKYVGGAKSTVTTPISDIDTDKYIKEICAAGGDHQGIQTDDVCLTLVTLDYGMGNENPAEHICFYRKEDPTKAIKVKSEQVSRMLPENYQDQVIRLYSRKTESVSTAKRCFDNWCDRPAQAWLERIDLVLPAVEPPSQ